MNAESTSRDDMLTRSAERRERVRVLTAQGSSTREIALALGVSTRSITRIRCELGIAQKPLPHMTAEQKTEAARLLDDGCSFAEAGRSVGLSGRTIADHFPGRGWTREQGSAWGLFMRRANQQRRTAA